MIWELYVKKGPYSKQTSKQGEIQRKKLYINKSMVRKRENKINPVWSID